jgi:hypothetical protein
MPQDHTASTVAQARVIRDGLDFARDETPVRTATLALLLDALIDLGSQPNAEKLREAARAEIASRTISIAKTQEAFQKVLDAERAAAEARANA